MPMTAIGIIPLLSAALTTTGVLVAARGLGVIGPRYVFDLFPPPPFLRAAGQLIFSGNEIGPFQTIERVDNVSIDSHERMKRHLPSDPRRERGTTRRCRRQEEEGREGEGTDDVRSGDAP